MALSPRFTHLLRRGQRALARGPALPTRLGNFRIGTDALRIEGGLAEGLARGLLSGSGMGSAPHGRSEMTRLLVAMLAVLTVTLGLILVGEEPSSVGAGSILELPLLDPTRVGE